MKTEILIVSYAKDIPYLDYALRSIAKFASGFSGVTLLVPTVEYEEFKQRLPDAKVNWRTYTRVVNPALWHLQHQLMKCRADQLCQHADFILHTDSDCIFTEPVTPEDYFKDGKPVMLIEAFARLPADFPWKPTVDRALGGSAVYETMRRHPQVNPRLIYADLRHHIETRHHIPFDDYVLKQKADFPWGFSEHCTIGAFALMTEWRFEYHWIDVALDPRPPDKLTQFWSHSPLDKPQGTPFGLNLVPLELCQKLNL